MAVVRCKRRCPRIEGESGAERQHTVNKITVRRVQLVVNFADEVRPIKIRIALLWHVDAEVVAKHVRIVALQKRWKPDSVLALF